MTKTIDTNQIVANYRFASRFTDYDKEHSKVIFWLEWIDGKYPLNFIGRGLRGVSEGLGITERQALNLLISKYSVLLNSLEDSRVREVLSQKIHGYKFDRGDFQLKNRPRICRGCGNTFFSTEANRRYCDECRKIPYWKRIKMRKEAKNLEKS